MAETPDRPQSLTKSSATSETSFGSTMSDAKRNVMDKTPWLPEKDRGASPTSTDMMGSMADGMGMTREKTLQPSMPPKGEKAPGAT